MILDALFGRKKLVQGMLAAQPQPPSEPVPEAALVAPPNPREAALAAHLEAKAERERIEREFEEFANKHLAFCATALSRSFGQRYQFRDVLQRGRLQPELDDLLRRRFAADHKFQDTLEKWART